MSGKIHRNGFKYKETYLWVSQIQIQIFLNGNIFKYKYIGKYFNYFFQTLPHTSLYKRNKMTYQELEISSLLSFSHCFHSKGLASNYVRYGYDDDTTWFEKPLPEP